MEPYLRLNVNLDGDRAGRLVGAREIVAAIVAAASRRSGETGLRLPPVRVLAHQLGISKNTVAAAYAEAAARGVVAGRRRRGVFLRGKTAAAHAEPGAAPPAPRLQPARLPSHGAGAHGAVSLSHVFVDPDLLPRRRLSECIRSVLRTPGIHAFYEAQGHAPLRRAIADRLRRRGIPAAAEHVLITTGSQQALDVVCRALADRRVATENPAYFLARRLFEMNGVAVTGLPFDPFGGPDLDAWSRQLRAARPSLLYLTTNFHNPTGYSHTTEGLETILAIAAEIGMGILEDDWGSDMLSFSEFRPSLRALGGPGVLYMNSFTKKLLPSMRIGYLLANEQTIGALVEAKRVSTLGGPMLLEASLFEFLDRGYYDTHLEGLQRALDERYGLCLDLLRRHMPDGVSWTTPGGGPLLWMELPRAVDLDRLSARLLERGIVIDATRESFFGTPHLHGFKLGYAYPKPAQLERAIPMLGAAITREMRRT